MDGPKSLAERVTSIVASLSYQAFNVCCPDSPWIPALLATASNVVQDQAKRIEELEAELEHARHVIAMYERDDEMPDWGVAR